MASYSPKGNTSTVSTKSWATPGPIGLTLTTRPITRLAPGMVMIRVWLFGVATTTAFARLEAGNVRILAGDQHRLAGVQTWLQAPYGIEPELIRRNSQTGER